MLPAMIEFSMQQTVAQNGLIFLCQSSEIPTCITPCVLQMLGTCYRRYGGGEQAASTLRACCSEQYMQALEECRPSTLNEPRLFTAPCTQGVWVWNFLVFFSCPRLTPHPEREFPVTWSALWLIRWALLRGWGGLANHWELLVLKRTKKKRDDKNKRAMAEQRLLHSIFPALYLVCRGPIKKPTKEQPVIEGIIYTYNILSDIYKTFKINVRHRYLFLLWREILCFFGTKPSFYYRCFYLYHCMGVRF